MASNTKTVQKVIAIGDAPKKYRVIGNMMKNQQEYPDLVQNKANSGRLFGAQ